VGADPVPAAGSADHPCAVVPALRRPRRGPVTPVVPRRTRRQSMRAASPGGDPSSPPLTANSPAAGKRRHPVPGRAGATDEAGAGRSRKRVLRRGARASVPLQLPSKAPS
jgi:hypothetical protein